MTNELLNKAENLISKTENAAVSSIDESGYPRIAMMSSIKTEGIDTIWFSTGTTSNKVKNFKRTPKASVCYCNGGNNVTLIGDIVIIEDQEIKTNLWVDWFINHFPLGVNDPNYCVFKFKSKYMQVWIDNEFDEIIINNL